MPRINWEKVFSKCFPENGATEAELLALTSTICNLLSDEEVGAINASQRNPFHKKTHPLYATWKPYDPRRWQLPSKPLPRSYLAFLKWSNGGSFIIGERRFDPLFRADTLRSYLLCYSIPQYMPESLPFAFDGGGCFYLFDMRCDPVKGEYPILFADAGNLGYDDAAVVAASFVEACKGRTDPRDLRKK